MDYMDLPVFLISARYNQGSKPNSTLTIIRLSKEHRKNFPPMGISKVQANSFGIQKWLLIPYIVFLVDTAMSRILQKIGMVSLLWNKSKYILHQQLSYLLSS